MTVPKLPLLRRACVLSLAALAFPAVAAADPAGHVTASSGSVSASLQWKTGGDVGGVTAAHLTIVRSGVTVLDADLSTDDCSACSFTTGAAGRTTPLTVADLDGDGEPEVLVDTYSGGAHCCYSDLIYRFSGGAYTHINQLWGDEGITLRDLNGDRTPELVTVADVFAYAFTSFADSYLPPLIERYSAGQLTDVTSDFPAPVKADASRILKLIKTYRRQRRDLRGLVAADVADENTLGHEATGVAFLAKERKNHDLGSDRRAKAFEKALGKFLKKYGYT